MFNFIKHITMDNIGWALVGTTLLLLGIGIVHAVKFVFVPMVKEWVEYFKESHQKN